MIFLESDKGVKGKLNTLIWGNIYGLILFENTVISLQICK